MKKLVLLAILVASTQIAIAQNDEDEVNYFEVASHIAKPVTIKTNLGTYEIWGGEVIRGHISRCTPRDANGNLIVNNQAYKTEWGTNKTTKKYWRFDDTYEAHSSNNENNKSAATTGSNRASDFAETMTNYANRASDINCYGYPNFQIRAGWSSHFGEMLTLKTEYSGKGGYVLEGGIGKDFFCEDPLKSLSWYAGVGIYGGSEDGNDISGSIIVGCNQLHSGIMIGADLEYSHFFSKAPHLGLYLGGFGGIYADGNDLNMAGGIMVGLSLRLF